MEQDATGISQRIDAARGLVLLTGPGACGKTTAAIDFYLRRRQQGQRCLLVVPNAQAVGAVRNALLQRSPGGVITGPDVMTFGELARRIVRATQPCRTIGPFQRSILLGRIIRELCAQGRLGALSGLADTPGLLASVDKALSELKRSAVMPEQLAALAARGPAKWRDLAEIYACYQRQLLQQGLYDAEGLMWQAREILTSSPNQTGLQGELAAAAAVAVDGFTDFTPTQMHILAQLAGRLSSVLVTLPWDDDGRERLWRWTARGREQLRTAVAGRLTEIHLSRRAAPLSPLWQAATDLDATFDWPAEAKLIASCGCEAEVDAVIRRVKALLLAGEKPGSIAITARSIEPYREMLAGSLAAHGIAADVGRTPLTQCPIVRFALCVAALAPQFEYAPVLAVIRSSYFRPAALGDFDASTVIAAEQLIRKGNVLGGVESYAATARRLAQLARASQGQASPGEPDEDAGQPPPAKAVSADDYERAGRMLERLFELAASAQSAPGLLGLIDTMELPQAALASGQTELVARDLRALDAMHHSLAWAGDCDSALWEIEQALGTFRLDSERGPRVIDVLDLLDARAMRYRHVFVLGVNDGQLPQRAADSGLLGQAERSAWARQGLRMDDREELAGREMLLFYMALSRADASLTLSYLQTDASGRPQAISPFLEMLCQSSGGGAAEATQVIPPGMLLPGATELATADDLFTAGVCGTFEPAAVEGMSADRARQLLAWAAGSRPDALHLASQGIWARTTRWASEPHDRYDGRLDSPPVLGALGRRFPGRTVFSASMINAYAACPWMFFARYVLNLRPLLEPQRQIEPADRGTFIHAVLFDMMQRLGGPVALAKVEQSQLAEALDLAAAAQSAVIEQRPMACPALWPIQRSRMRQDIWEYLLAQRAGGLDARCTYFELAFGLAADTAGQADARSTPQPVTIDTPAGPIRLRGKIDRVDDVSLDGVSGLLVVDYKSGRLPSRKDVNEGRHVQLPLYIHAARALLEGPCVGGAFHSVRPEAKMVHFGQIDYSAGGYKMKPDFEQRLQAATQTVGRYVQGMAGGSFELLPSSKCPQWCDMRRICHFSPARDQIKRDAIEAAAAAAASPAAQDADAEGRQ